MKNPKYSVGQKFYRVYITPYHARFHIDTEIVTITRIEYVEYLHNMFPCYHRYYMSNDETLREDDTTLVRPIEMMGEKYFLAIEDAINYIANTTEQICNSVKDEVTKSYSFFVNEMQKKETIYNVF